MHRADGEQRACSAREPRRDLRGEPWSDVDFVAEGLLRSVHGLFLTLHCMKAPQHSPRVLLSEKVNRIKKTLPNAF